MKVEPERWHIIWKIDGWFENPLRLHDLFHTLGFMGLMLIALAFGSSWTTAFLVALGYVIFKEGLFDPITLGLIQYRKFAKFELDNLFDAVTYLTLGLPLTLVALGRYTLAVLCLILLIFAWNYLKRFRSDKGI
jgi:hypothetical protein